MKCQDVQELLPDYADGQLIAATHTRIDQHLATCEGCQSEYEIWKDSGKWIQAEKEQYTHVPTARSIVDVVMARILSEEKWAIPIGKKVFTLTARMRRIGASAAMVLLLLCAFTLYNTTKVTDEAAGTMMLNGESTALGTADKAAVISSNLQDDNGTYVVEEEPLISAGHEAAEKTTEIMPIHDERNDTGPKYGIILSFFGILITVIGLSWMTRA